MESIRTLYKVGFGPSSSHTMGPYTAAKAFVDNNPRAASFQVLLEGSLALTGKGHLTDFIIRKALSPNEVEVLWDSDTVHPFHPNSMVLSALDTRLRVLSERRVFSVGGGNILWEGEEQKNEDNTYPHNTLSEVKAFCNEKGWDLWDYIRFHEEKDILEYLAEIYREMKETARRGLAAEGILPGELECQRKAQRVMKRSRAMSSLNAVLGRINATALAVSEENATGGRVVTAPTCGSSGVLPGVILVLETEYHISEVEILKALAIGGLIGCFVRHNASISGAEAGCQAEVGTACSMAAAALVYLFGGTTENIDNAAEIAMEHNLGMTCDPVKGYVQIPCMERNAVAAVKAFNVANYALLSGGGKNKISFDTVVEVMRETGQDMTSPYRETAVGGLAKHYIKKLEERSTLKI